MKAAAFDASICQEIAGDPGALVQAAGIVVLAPVLAIAGRWALEGFWSPSFLWLWLPMSVATNVAAWLIAAASVRAIVNTQVTMRQSAIRPIQTVLGFAFVAQVPLVVISVFPFRWWPPGYWVLLACLVWQVAAVYSGLRHGSEPPVRPGTCISGTRRDTGLSLAFLGAVVVETAIEACGAGSGQVTTLVQLRGVRGGLISVDSPSARPSA